MSATPDPNYRPGQIIGNSYAIASVTVKGDSRYVSREMSAVPVYREDSNGEMQRVGSVTAGAQSADVESRSVDTQGAVMDTQGAVMDTRPTPSTANPGIAVLSDVVSIGTNFGKIPLPVKGAVCGNDILHLVKDADSKAQFVIPNADAAAPLEIWVGERVFKCIYGGWSAAFGSETVYTFLTVE